MIPDALYLLGFLLAFTGGFIGCGVLTGSPALQPTNPLPLVVLASVTTVVEIVLTIAGFWIYGWRWLFFFIAIAAAAGWLGKLSQKSRAAPGLSALYMTVGLGLILASWAV